MKRAVFSLLIFCSSAFAQDELWLQTFPEITWDNARVCFSNDKWTAVYFAPTIAMFTVSNDSIALPVMPDKNTAMHDLDMYRGGMSGIFHSPFAGVEVDYTLPPLPQKTANEISATWKLPADVVLRARETTGPLVWSNGKLWFGMRAELPDAKQVIGGIGWFDPESKQMARVYSHVLNGMIPQTIGARDDTLYAFYKAGYDSANPGKLIAFSAATSNLFELDPRGGKIPGQRILGAGVWNDTLVIATDKAVALWPPNVKPRIWTSKAFAARSEIWLKALLFKPGTTEVTTTTDFFPLRVNAPSEAMAQIGHWIELVPPVGIEGYVSKEDWQKYGSHWTNVKWNCDPPCFARITIPKSGRDIVGDFLDTPLTYLGEDGRGVKIGFAAGWIQMDKVTPVMVPYRH